MIMVEEKDGEVTCKVQGTAPVIIAEIGVVVNKAYRMMHDDKPVLAMMFRDIVTHMMTDDNSPAWKLD